MKQAASLESDAPLSPSQRTQLAAESDSDPGTVRRLYAGAPARSTSRRRIEDAAKRLGLPLPPPRKPSSGAGSGGAPSAA